jgi:hypothetical protein
MTIETSPLAGMTLFTTRLIGLLLISVKHLEKTSIIDKKK